MITAGYGPPFWGQAWKPLMNTCLATLVGAYGSMAMSMGSGMPVPLGFGFRLGLHDLLLALDLDPLQIPLGLQRQLLGRLLGLDRFVKPFRELEVGDVQLVQ